MVSVIIPNYNHARYLEARIESILNQTFTGFEVIILDDCSTDESRTIIEKYRLHPKVSHIIYNETNTGSTFIQWLKGIQLAKGEYIWIAESDDYCDPTFLEKTLSWLEKNECSLCFTESWVVDELGSNLGKYESGDFPSGKDSILDGNQLIQDHFTKQNIIPNASGLVFKRKFINPAIIEGLTDYKINGDWFLWINLLMNRQGAYINEPLNFFRRYEGSGSSANITNFRNIEEAIRINCFLKKNGFKVTGRYWIKAWISQADYSYTKLFRSNFIRIYKQSLELFPFPLVYMSLLVAGKWLYTLYSTVFRTRGGVAKPRILN